MIYCATFYQVGYMNIITFVLYYCVTKYRRKAYPVSTHPLMPGILQAIPHMLLQKYIFL